MLVTADELHRMLSAGEVVVFDCRFVLTDPDAGRRRYEQGHIPGAVYLDLERDLSGPVTPTSGRHPLPDPRDLARKLGDSGVGEGTSVVVYDGGEGMAPRAWWLIRYLGHDDVRVLDGGLDSWVRAGYELSAEEPAPPPRTFTPRVRADWVVDVSEVERAVAGENDLLLIDARAAERYRGEVEPLHPKAGHIPGARNAPWEEGVDHDGRWRSPEEQRARFEPLLEGGAQVVSYCGSGVTACANLFALELAGIRNAKLYPGSWSQWCSDDSRPVATGDE